MYKKIITIFLSLALLAALPAMAAPKDGAGRSSTPGPRKQIATIIFAGLAGAVLGLSTLSFYGRPQDKLPNIGVGFALGIITGACYTTYKAATQPKDFYGIHEPEIWRQANLQPISPPTPQLGYSWTF